MEKIFVERDTSYKEATPSAEEVIAQELPQAEIHPTDTTGKVFIVVADHEAERVFCKLARPSLKLSTLTF